MNTRGEIAGIDELLGHAGWARGLARALCRNDAAADDLLQEAWLVVLHERPDANRPTRPWLAQVIRNLFRMRLRAGGRRDRREEAASIVPDPVLAPEELLERVQQQRQLGDLVLALDEPFRSTLLLRFYEDLDGAEIARRLGVPAGTVRWRLKEGLDRLRVQLDARYAGNRRAWQRALAPLGGIEFAKAGGLALVIKGGLLMKTLVTITLLAAGGFLLLRVGAPPQSRAARSAEGPPSATASAAPSRSQAAAPPRLDAPQRKALLERLAHARSAREANHRAPGAGGGEVAAATLDPGYIEEQIGALKPLLLECYEDALRRAPKLAGKIVTNFTITGEPGVGGLVSESTIADDESTISDPELRECFSNTMFAAQFPAPSEGGEVAVRYPFVLEP